MPPSIFLLFSVSKKVVFLLRIFTLKGLKGLTLLPNFCSQQMHPLFKKPYTYGNCNTNLLAQTPMFSSMALHL